MFSSALKSIQRKILFWTLSSIALRERIHSFRFDLSSIYNEVFLRLLISSALKSMQRKNFILSFIFNSYEGKNSYFGFLLYTKSLLSKLYQIDCNLFFPMLFFFGLKNMRRKLLFWASSLLAIRERIHRFGFDVSKRVKKPDSCLLLFIGLCVALLNSAKDVKIRNRI